VTIPQGPTLLFVANPYKNLTNEYIIIQYNMS